MRDYPFLVVAALIGVGTIGGLAAGGVLRIVSRASRRRERRTRRRDDDDEDSNRPRRRVEHVFEYLTRTRLATGHGQA